MTPHDAAGKRDYHADIAAIDIRLHALRGELRSALIEGASTGSIRSKMSALEAQRADIAALLEQAEATRHQAEREAIDAAAATLATESTARISQLLGDLQPRAAPVLAA